MYTALAVLACSLLAVFFIRRLARERQLCSMCGRLVSRTTLLDNGQKLCTDCILNNVWDTLDRNAETLPGSHTLPRRVLRPKDPMIGRKCPFCGMAFTPLDTVSVASDGIAHIGCLGFAEAIVAADEVKNTRS